MGGGGGVADYLMQIDRIYSIYGWEKPQRKSDNRGVNPQIMGKKSTAATLINQITSNDPFNTTKF